MCWTMKTFFLVQSCASESKEISLSKADSNDQRHYVVLLIYILLLNTTCFYSDKWNMDRISIIINWSRHSNQLYKSIEVKWHKKYDIIPTRRSLDVIGSNFPQICNIGALKISQTIFGLWMEIMNDIEMYEMLKQKNVL